MSYFIEFEDWNYEELKLVYDLLDRLCPPHLKVIYECAYDQNRVTREFFRAIEKFYQSG